MPIPFKAIEKCNPGVIRSMSKKVINEEKKSQSSKIINMFEVIPGLIGGLIFGTLQKAGSEL
jgi:hypothetical protein